MIAFNELKIGMKVWVQKFERNADTGALSNTGDWVAAKVVELYPKTILALVKLSYNRKFAYRSMDELRPEPEGGTPS